MTSLLSNLGIESLFGPNWESDLGTICTALGGETNEICALLKSIPVADNLNPFALGEFGVKSGEHLLQNILEERWAEYDDNFKTFDSFQAPLIDLDPIPSSIKTGWLFRNQDQLCPYASEIGNLSEFSNDANTVFLDGSHGDSSGANDAEFLAALDSLLLDTVEEILPIDC